MYPKTYDEGWKARRMREPTPLNLKRLLAQQGLSQVNLCNALTLIDGTIPSEATVSQIIRRDIWPRRTPKAFLKKQIDDFLRTHEVPEHEISTALEIDDDPDGYAARPGKTRRSTGTTAPVISEIQLPENEMLSQQAKRHFKLFNDPFIDDVKGPDDVYLSEDQRYIREAMYYAAKNGGFLAVIGESGAGKSTLRKDLIDRITRQGEPITVIQPRIIDKGRLTAGAICDAIIEDVSSEAPKRTLEAKARQIERLLTGSGRSGNAHVLIIEEAHDLTVATLKYLKRFWELEDGFKRLLGIVLVGQPELKGALDLRRNWDAREVINRCEIAELHPLNGNLEDYIRAKLKRVGKSLGDIFHPEAFDAIRTRLQIPGRSLGATVSMMYPLVVNNTVSKAMNLAAEIGEEKVNAEIIKGV